MMRCARYHLPGLFEFYELYKRFLQLWREHREYFYDWCDIGSIYGAPGDALWGGGRVGYGDADIMDVVRLVNEYDISARLTFSNSLITNEHLGDRKCNKLLEALDSPNNGVIIHSKLLLDYIKERYQFYYVSSTTKVITNPKELINELEDEDYRYVVADFRFNNNWDFLKNLNQDSRNKIEFLCNECCYIDCHARASCYENVSKKALGIECEEHRCVSPNADKGYTFSGAMDSPAFIGIGDIANDYLPMGFSEFKIEGRSLGSAIVLEFILYYMTKPEYQLKVRERIYLDSMLDIF